MRKKIIILVPKLSNGGTEKVASSISCALDKEKYEIINILYFNDRIDFPYSGKLIDLDIKTSGNPFNKLLAFFKRVIKVYKIKRKEDPYATISFGSNPNLINILTSFNDKTILTVHFNKFHEKKNIYKKIYTYIIKFLYNKASYIVGVSKMVADGLVKNYSLNEEKVKPIYNFLDLKEIEMLSKENLEEEYKDIFNYPVIITVGRLEYQKGHWHLIKAFSQLKTNHNNLQLVIIGEGKMKEELINLAKIFKLEDSIHLIGFQRNPYKFIKRADIFAFTSIYEGFGIVIAEALACKTPVVSSDCKSGPREILSPNSKSEEILSNIEYGEFGVLTPDFDKKIKWDLNLTEQDILFSKATDRLLSDQSLYDSYKSKIVERAKSFDSKVIIRQYEELIDK